MLKFFQKIRQKLLSEGYLSKYLAYAIGEILLVMIGILLALQVSNWNEWRKDRIQEKLLLKEIHEEFKYNKSEFEGNLKRYGIVRENIKAIIESFPINLRTVKLDSLADLLERIHWVGNYDKSATTIAKLKSTSSFDIISSEELRSLLLRWEVLASDYEKDEARAIKYMLEGFSPIMSKKLPRPYYKGLRDPRVGLNFLTSLEFESLIKSRYIGVNNLFRTVEDDTNIVTVMDRIIELSGGD